MSDLALTQISARAQASRRAAAYGTAMLVLVLLGVGLARILDSTGIPPALALLGGLALVSFLLLAIRHYDTAVAIGLLLMGVVRFEPAPPDLAFAVIMTVAAVTGRFRLNRVPQLLRATVGLLLVVNLLSLIDTTSTSTALRFLFITTYLLIFTLWLTDYVDSTSRSRLVVVTWLLVGVVSSVISVLALNLPFPGRSVILGNVDYGERASGFFKDPNVFGPFLIPIAVILLDQRLSRRYPKLIRTRPWVTWLLLLVLTLGVVFSYSRAAWASYAIAVVVTLVASSMRRNGAMRSLRALAMLLFIGGTVAVILSVTGSISFLEHRAQFQSYDTQRFAAQTLGWQLGWTHPVGIGPGQFELLSPVASHSTFVRVFAEQGPLGMLLWVGLLLATLVLALRNVVIGRDTYGIGSAALLGAWCGLIFNSVVVDTLHWRHLWVVGALIWAAAARPVARPPRPALADRRDAPPNGWPPAPAAPPPTIVRPGASPVRSR